MTGFGKTSIIVAITASLLFLLTGIMPYQQQQHLLQQPHYFNTAEAGGGEALEGEKK